MVSLVKRGRRWHWLDLLPLTLAFPGGFWVSEWNCTCGVPPWLGPGRAMGCGDEGIQELIPG